MTPKSKLKISFIIPTLNAQKVLEPCLKSIKSQNFNNNSFEIIIADGGSTDKTLSIAQKYNCRIVPNILKTAEAGKAVGVSFSKGEYIALIDSDNILPNSNWIQEMLTILDKNPELIGAEPYSFTYRKKAGLIERYSALIGANDPYAFVTGFYDRKNYVNYKITGLPVEQKDYPAYIRLKLKPGKPIPTIGANGTVFRSAFLRKELINTDYLFDIDIISKYLTGSQSCLYFAKSKNGIIHTYCENSIKKFIIKQKRRISDYFQYRPLRHFDWSSGSGNDNLFFAIYSTTLILPLVDSVRGFFHQPDTAWFFHLPACLITLYVYATASIKNKLGLLKNIDRRNWSQ